MNEIAANAAKETKEKSAARVRKQKFVPLERDRDIVRWIYDVRATTRAQIQRMFFGPGGRSRSQERLGLLLRNRYVDRLPGRLPNQPDVFVISRRSINGLRLLRAARIDHQSTHPIGPARLAHQLEINGCRVQIAGACSRPPYTFMRWDSEDDLQELMAREAILPDAYFQVVRETEAGERRAGFFLEVERSDKSDRLLREKFQALGRFYYGGRFEQLFGSKALRCLVLIGDSYGIRSERRIEKFAEIAARLDVTFLRFAPLATFLALAPQAVFQSAIWRRPESAALVPLFEQ